MLVNVNAEIIKISIGVFLILVVIYKRWFKSTFKMNNYLLIPGGMLTGFISGLIGSAGPIGAVLFLGLKLPPLAYISSEAFTALAMHFAKIIVYGKYELLDQKTMLIGVLAGFAMVAGSYAGKAIINRISKSKMDLVIEVLLIVSAVQLIVG